MDESITSLMMIFIVGFIVIAGLTMFIDDAGARHPAARNNTNFTFFNQSQTATNTISNMVNTTQTNQITTDTIFGVPFAISLNALNAIKSVFSFINVGQSLLTDILNMTGLGLGWLASWLIIAFSLLVTFLFINAILRWRA